MDKFNYYLLTKDGEVNRLLKVLHIPLADIEAKKHIPDSGLLVLLPVPPAAA